MTKFHEAVQSIAEGRAIAVPVKMAWAVHDGMRGATWTIVQSDGKLIERRRVGPPKVGQPAPIHELGSLPAATVQELASTLIRQGFDQLQPGAPASPGGAQVVLSVEVDKEKFSVELPSHQLGSVPAMQAIRDAFMQIRGQFPA